MKTIKALLIAVFTAAMFTMAQAQIKLPPPPPHPAHPPLPKIHLRLHNPPPPPAPPRRKAVVVRHRTHVVKRHYYYKNGVRHYRTY